MSPLPKVVLLVLAAVAMRVAFKPPNPPPSKDDKINKGTLFDTYIRMIVFVMQALNIMCLLTEAGVILSLQYQTAYSAPLLSNLCRGSTPSLTGLSTLSPLFILGTSLIFSAAALRLWCFRTLGRFFTFEITIRPGHQLITSGPYAYVRHPSYTATIALMVGPALVALQPHSYVGECHIMSTPVRWVVYTWLFYVAYGIVSLVKRGKVEDKGLKKEFGETWDKYSNAVPCRLVPGLL